MQTENPKEIKVGDYEQVEGGNFVSVTYPEPQYGTGAQAGIAQLLASMTRSQALASASAAPAGKADKGDSGDTENVSGKTATKADVDAARSKK